VPPCARSMPWRWASRRGRTAAHQGYRLLPRPTAHGRCRRENSGGRRQRVPGGTSPASARRYSRGTNSLKRTIVVPGWCEICI
jgi:hypothetical protein